MMQSIDNGRPAEILLVEDNAVDVMLTKESFAQSKFAINLHHVENGVECLAFLRKEDQYKEMPTPDLILLDMNMPIMDGREVMEEISKDDKLKHLPVVVLTTSKDEQDILEMYKLRCNAYITKPVNFTKFQEIIHNITNHWFTVVVLPTGESDSK